MLTPRLHALQQIGQVMLALPHAISLMGLRAACVIIPCYTLFSMWTMHLLNTLYVEYKARKVRCASCEGTADVICVLHRFCTLRWSTHALGSCKAQLIFSMR